MTFLAPVWIGHAAMASLAVAAIHLIAWRLPRTVTLPTARFVPDEPARRAARTVRPSDLALLALRIAIVMVGGVAMARPRFTATPGGEATVIAIEHSRAVADMAALRGSVREPAGQGVVSYVVFDTAAHAFADQGSALGALGAEAPAEASLTAGLLAAIREGRRLEREFETVHIVVVSTFTRRAFDEATRAVRDTWQDSVRLVRVAAAAHDLRPAIVESTASVEDPVVAGIRLAISNGLIHGASRVIRDSLVSVTSLTVDSGRSLVYWPRLSSGAVQRVDGIHAGGSTAIGHFVQGSRADSGRVIARWVNGTPVAWEIMQGAGCLRTIGFDVPDVGDFTLSPSFQRLAAQLLRPCIDEHSDVAPDSVIAELARPVSSRAKSDVPDELHPPNRLAAVLLSVAILLAIVELWFRRRTTSLPAEELA